MSSERLFRFQKPAWMNSATTRTAGVYLAGALVNWVSPSAVVSADNLQTVLSGFLFLRRRCHLLALEPQWLHCTYQLCRLDTGNMLCAGNAGHQQH